jgi:hypothetical protein
MLLVRFCRGDPDHEPSSELQICYVDRETALPIYHHLHGLVEQDLGRSSGAREPCDESKILAFDGSPISLPLCRDIDRMH